jgi:hypothetical protein
MTSLKEGAWTEDQQAPEAPAVVGTRREAESRPSVIRGSTMLRGRQRTVGCGCARED